MVMPVQAVGGHAVDQAPAQGLLPKQGCGAGNWLVNELERLGRLHSQGILDADEFRAAKRQLLMLGV